MTGCNHRIDWRDEMGRRVLNPLEVLEGTLRSRILKVALRANTT